MTILALTGCVNYPKNYTYSPTITVGNNSKTDMSLPSPFATTAPKMVTKTITRNINRHYYNDDQYVSQNDYHPEEQYPQPQPNYVSDVPRYSYETYAARPRPRQTVIYQDPFVNELIGQ